MTFTLDRVRDSPDQTPAASPGHARRQSAWGPRSMSPCAFGTCGQLAKPLGGVRDVGDRSLERIRALGQPVLARWHDDEIPVVAQDVNAGAQLPTHGSFDAVEPQMPTTVATSANRGHSLRQWAVPGLQFGQTDIASVPRVDIKHDLTGVRPRANPVVGVGGPVFVGPLDIGSGVIEPMAWQSALAVAFSPLGASPRVRAGQRRGLAARNQRDGGKTKF